MTQDVTLEFKPDGYRYYYDYIQVRSVLRDGSDSPLLVVPIHAYPVMNEVVFPRHVEFSNSALGETHSKVISIECKIPMDFDYELTVLEPHPSITISPLRGVVPGGGKADVRITFKAIDLAVVRAELLVNVSQFGFKPQPCSITACATPGLARDKAVASLPRQKKKPVMSGGGAGGGDAYTQKMYTRRVKGSGMTLTLPKGRPTTALSTARTMGSRGGALADVEEVEGIRFPRKLTGHASMAYVLTQQPGRLKVKDLKDAIAAKNKVKSERENALADASIRQGALTIGQEESAETLLDVGNNETRQVREMLFEQARRQRAEDLRSREMRAGTSVAVGQIPPSDQILAAVRRKLIQIEDDANNDARRVSAARRQSSQSDKRVIVSLEQRQDSFKMEPQFDVLSNNDTLTMRRDVNQRFLFAARTVVLRIRAERRLAMLRKLIEHQVEKRKVIEHAVSVESRLTAERIKSQPIGGVCKDVEGDVMMIDGKEEAAIRPGHAVAVPKFRTDFIDQPKHQLRVTLHYRQLGYQPLPFTEPGPAPPVVEGRPVLEGAEEEYGIRPPRGPHGPDADSLVHPPFASTAPPPLCSMPLLVLKPEPGMKVKAPRLPYAETDPDGPLRPRLRLLPQVNEPLGMNGLKAVEGEAILSDRWLPYCGGPSSHSMPLMNGPDAADIEQSVDDADELVAGLNKKPVAADLYKKFPPPPGASLRRGGKVKELDRRLEEQDWAIARRPGSSHSIAPLPSARRAMAPSTASAERLAEAEVEEEREAARESRVKMLRERLESWKGALVHPGQISIGQ